MTDSNSQSDLPSDSLKLWRLGGLSVFQLIRESIREYRQHRMAAVCAQFAYYSLLALAPLLILIVSAAAQIPIDGTWDELGKTLSRNLPRDAMQIIESQASDIQSRSSLGLVAVSFLILGFAGSRVFWTMGKALDLAFDSVGRRRVWVRGTISLALTFGVFLLLLITMILLVVSPIIVDYLFSDVPISGLMRGSYVLLHWGIASSFLLLVASLMYWLAPSAKVPWHWFSPGSVFASIGWVTVMRGFRFFVENFGRYNETYGALAGVIVLMTWMYLTGAVLLMGGQINGVIYRAEMRRRAEGESA